MATAAIARALLLLATTSLPGARGGVSDTVLGQAKVVEMPARTASAPALRDASGLSDEELPEMLRTPATGSESLVMCSGRQICRGETVLGGVRACAEGLECADVAVILLQGGASSAYETADDVEGMSEDTAEAVASANVVGADASISNVYICPGRLICKDSFVRFGRLWCVGGYQCLPQ